MKNKKKTKYTTIQVRKDFHQNILDYCDRHAIVISAATEKLWEAKISSSLSGSSFFGGI